MTKAVWVSYPDWASCFADCMATLLRLASAFQHHAALAAKDPETRRLRFSRQEKSATNLSWPR